MPPRSSSTSPERCTGWSGSRSPNSRTIRSSWIPKDRRSQEGSKASVGCRQEAAPRARKDAPGGAVRGRPTPVPSAVHGSRKIGEAKKEVKRQWDAAKKQLHEPGKMHRVERFAVAQLPYHPQFMDPGSSFNADLRRPLDFGTEPLTPAVLEHIGTPPPSGSVVHAILVTPLGSAQSKKGDPVEAVITQPLLVSDHLFLPEGSRLKGSVLPVQPARRLSRNGHLRIVFHQVVPPSGIEEKVEASLEGVQV